MLVRGPGIPDQRRGLLVAVPALAKGHERSGIEPGRAAVLMGGQQLLERAVIVLSEQAPSEDVPDPLIVAARTTRICRIRVASTILGQRASRRSLRQV
jgi:hypothetical protein